MYFRPRFLFGGLVALLILSGIGVAQARPIDDGQASPRVTIRTTSPSNGQTVAGNVSWQVQVVAGTPTQIRFYVDSTLVQSLYRSPYSFLLDTTKLADGGHTLTAVANGFGSSDSDSVTVQVANSSHGKKPPGNTAPPVITGTVQVGQTLSSSTGSWQGTQPISYAYQWQRCDSGGGNCANIPGASGSTYTVASADQGSTLRVTVTATNALGSSSAQSAATGVVAGTGGGQGQGKQLYWGAWIGKQFTGAEAPWDMTAVSDFESLTGKPVSLIQFSSPWQNCYSSPCTSYKFDTTAMNNIRNHGAIPFFSWSSESLPFSVNEPNFSLSTIINGSWDSYITTWAQAAKDWGHPFFLRLDWEMNGNWFPWAEGVNGNTSGQYAQAWRHVHDIFASVGATNVTWVWCPNVDPGKSMTPLAGLYPGSDYVDWTCLDGYNWDKPWTSFDSLYKSTYNLVTGTVAPGKPMAIGETASTEKGGSKPSWIADLLANLPTQYPQVGALLWFEKYDGGMDWPIETSSSAVASFAAGIASSAYATNQFGSLGAGKIPPLP